MYMILGRFFKRCLRFTLRQTGCFKFAHLYSVHKLGRRLRRKKRAPFVFLFGSPYHPNLGDQAQTGCIVEWIKKHLPHHEISVCTLINSSNAWIVMIRQYIRPQDVLLCHSGYHMTDLYDEQSVYLKLARTFPDFPLTILPQTINYEHEENAHATAAILNAHPDCTLFCRDEQSYQTAKSLFYRCRLFLYPDIVTSMIGNLPLPPQKREGILFCMRNDKEAFYSPSEILHLMGILQTHTTTERTDTTVDLPVRYIVSHRKKVLLDTFKYFSRFKVVVTDRYHGTIFSLIAGTPVIVLNSKDHKLSSGVKWFPDSFHPYVRFAASLDQVPTLANEMMARKEERPLPPYFSETYFDHLLEKLHV